MSELIRLPFRIGTGVICLAVLLGGLIAAAQAADSIGKNSNVIAPLKGVDLDGRLRHFGERNKTKAIVVVFLSLECPISNSYVPILCQMSSKYRRRGVEFYGVISDPSVTRADASVHRLEYHVSFPVLFDGSGELRRGFSATHTPQAFVLNAHGSLRYQGAIDNQYVKLGTKQERATKHYLDDAIQSTLLGKRPSVVRSNPIGCHLEEAPHPSSNSHISYTRDIAPIIQANCTTCHRAGQSAPFPLLTYLDVAKRAKQIVEVTQSRYMPPWKPAPGFGHFRDEQRLTEHEMALIKAWTKDGRPKGDSADLPICIPQTNKWRLGPPDQILRMREVHHVPSSGPDVRQYFVIPSRLKEDRLITAIDFHPGAPKAIHHASFFLDTKHAARKLDEADPDPGYRGFGGPRITPQGTLQSWFPGRSPQKLPKGTGRLLPRGSDIVAEIHYVCTGKPEHDRSVIALYHAPKSARHLIEEIQVANKRINIPAGASRHHERASYTLPVDTILLDTTPHMHVLGREMKVTATLPDDSITPLIWIKEWDFNWQSQYAYAEPVRLPKGTRIDVDAWYDNSAQNPLNPNSPPQDVQWGADSTDEMLICHFQCTCKSRDRLVELIADYKRYFESAQQSEQDAGDGRSKKKRKPRPAFR